MTTTQLTEIVLPGVVEPDGLIVNHRAVPVPGDGEALVGVEATGVSFAEKGMRRNRYPGQPRFPFVLGYDLVGEVLAVGGGVDPALVGTRVAAVTKIGGWTTHALVPARELTRVPDGVDPAEAEAVSLNGVTAWQMLHRSARVRRGQTVLVHGANGGVGLLLVQLAREAGVRVIGTAAPRHHDALRALGAEPLDYGDPDLAARVRGLAPAGVDAAFDHLGGASYARSFGLLADGGTLVAYGTASELDGSSSVLGTFAGILARFALWNRTPNGGRSASFYNFWGGKRVRPRRFRRRMDEDMRRVLALLAEGAISANVAARFPLDEASAALTLAESRTVYGKVVLVP